MRTNNVTDPAPQSILVTNNCSSNITLMKSLICIWCDGVYFSSIDCSYFGWSSWSSCSVSCGQGSRTRNRSCLYLNTNAACSDCTGANAQTQVCERQPCEGLAKNTWRKIFQNSLLACRLGPYVPASECSRTCGNGTQVFNQTCFNIADSSVSIPQVCSNTGFCSATSPINRTCNPDECISKSLEKENYRKGNTMHGSSL